METGARRVRAGLRALGRNRGRYPRWIREESMAYARARVRKGEESRAIAAELGVDVRTLGRWLGQGFRRVAVARRAEQPQMPASGGGLTVRTAAGYEVRGLDVAAAVTLLRGLA
jgi:hypothetical protein